MTARTVPGGALPDRCDSATGTCVACAATPSYRGGGCEYEFGREQWHKCGSAHHLKDGYACPTGGKVHGVMIAGCNASSVYPVAGHPCEFGLPAQPADDSCASANDGACDHPSGKCKDHTDCSDCGTCGRARCSTPPGSWDSFCEVSSGR